MKVLKSKDGFTLVELMVVISIIALLSSVVLAATTDLRKKATVSKFAQEMSTLQKAIELYRTNTGAYPSSSAPSPGLNTYGTTTDSLADQLITQGLISQRISIPSFINVGTIIGAAFIFTPYYRTKAYNSNVGFFNCGKVDPDLSTTRGVLQHDWVITFYSSEVLPLNRFYYSNSTDLNVWLNAAIGTDGATYYSYCISSAD